MRKRLFTIFKISISALVGVFLLLCFYPRSYDVLQFEERQGTEYWELDNGSRIGYTHIKATSNQNKSPIIYLHGGPGGMIQNKTIQLIKPLSEEGHDIYLYDQIGSGHSKRLKEISQYTVKRHTEDLEKIVELIDSEKVILIGHSWGTMLATNFYAQNKEKVERMIFLGPGPILPINSALSKIKSPDSLNLINPKYSNFDGNKKANNLRSKCMRRCASIFEKKLASDEEADDFFTHLINHLSMSTTCSGASVETSPYNGGGGYYTHIMTVNSFDHVANLKNQLRGNQIPILIIRGQCDNQKWGFTQEYLDLFPNASLEIIQSEGHSIKLHSHPLYIRIINNFLGSAKASI